MKKMEWDWIPRPLWRVHIPNANRPLEHVFRGTFRNAKLSPWDHNRLLRAIRTGVSPRIATVRATEDAAIPGKVVSVLFAIVAGVRTLPLTCLGARILVTACVNVAGPIFDVVPV